MSGVPKKTVLHDWHRKAGAKLVEFGGWEMPLHYAPGILEEHLTTRRWAGLFDISHMGRFRIRGRDALPFLQHVLTNNAAALEPGRAQYTMIGSEDGGAVDDAYLYQLVEGDFRLVVNAANTEKDFQWLSARRGGLRDVLLEDETDSIAMLSLQGPRSRQVLGGVLARAKGHLPAPQRNHFETLELDGVPVTVSRTGYTGEPIGFELFVPRAFAHSLWEEILGRGRPEGVLPIGLGARDSLRLEAGFPLYGHELGQDPSGRVIPLFSVPLAWFAVSLSPLKGEFVGRNLLTRHRREVSLWLRGELSLPLEERVVPRRVTPVTLTGRGVARQGYEVYQGDRLKGHITSGTVVPYWVFQGEVLTSAPGEEKGKRAIALAYLDSDVKEGEALEVTDGRRTFPGVVVEAHLRSNVPPYGRPVLYDAEGQAHPLQTARPLTGLSHLAAELVKKAAENTRWRQRATINLIPSEQTPSLLVKLLTIMDPMGRYAEHRNVPGLGERDVFYYQGTGFIEEVEDRLVREMARFLDCRNVEARTLSGQMANTAVFSALVSFLNRYEKGREPRRLRSVMTHHLGRGGHLSSQPLGALKDFVAFDPTTERPAVVPFPVLPEDPYRIDLGKTAGLLERFEPELLVFGKSMMLYREPVREIAEMARSLQKRPLLMYDMAHPLGLHGPYFQEPLKEGADVLTGSTHKTFFGTQRGLIASDLEEGTPPGELWEMVKRRTFPGSVSNHHLGTLLGLLMACHEMMEFKEPYQRQVLRNAKAFARALKEEGLPVEGDPALGHTETHQVILRTDYARGAKVASELESSHIILNYQAVPDDEGFTSSSGLRLGVQEMTRFGMREADFEELAGYMADVILRGRRVAEEVSAFRQRFTEMRYCLSEEEARPLAEALLEAIGPWTF